MERITLINPPLLTQSDDFLGSGIPYMPYPLAYLAAELYNNKYQVEVIDSFGINPDNVYKIDNFYIQGLEVSGIINRIQPDAKYVVVYFSTIMANLLIKMIIIAIKKIYPSMIVIVIENSEAVIGCSLEYIKDEIMRSGADYIILGEPEERIISLLEVLKNKASSIKLIDGLIYKNCEGELIVNSKNGFIKNLDKLNFPKWDLFPVENYWKLGYSHGPLESGRYLSLLTSRGCPFNCNFCIIPATNERKWRYRSPENVVSEIEYMIQHFEVYEYHLEDVNPTADEKRIIRLCELIQDKGLKIKWKLASGSKIETMSIETLEKMKRSGCNYISFSPESGSLKVLDLMGKPFNHAYALKMSREMNRLGIYSQACFVLGYPGETDDDLKMTEKYVRKLTRNGIDEIALFIMTPIPGTRTYGMIDGFKDYSELTFSPSWREDYHKLAKFRDGLYFKFLLWKMLYHPLKVIRQFFNLLMRSFKTKSEMNIYRVFKFKWYLAKSGRK